MAFTRDCPKCDFVAASDALECPRCGVIFARIRSTSAAATARASDDPPIHKILSGFLDRQWFFVNQVALHWWEILLDWEQRNEYQICDERGALLGHMVEQGHGFRAAMSRVFLGSHRPLDVVVFNAVSDIVLQLSRPFFWFFSSLVIQDGNDRKLGRIERRFGLIHKVYDLFDERDQFFARVKSPIWRLWHFPVLLPDERQVASVNKKWSGLAQEYFTDADNFQIDLGTHAWTPSQRAVVFAVALSIDFDFFENNRGSG